MASVPIQCCLSLGMLVALATQSGCDHLWPKPPAYPTPPPTVCLEAPCTAGDPQTPDADTRAAWPGQTQLIDLPTALQLANGQNPEIAVARERINEALAQQEQAELIWLPNLQYGPVWSRHDGQIQRSTGEVLTVSRSSLFVGSAAILSLDLSEAIYTPLAARQITEARRAGAAAVTHDRLLDAALAYIDLLQVYADLQINAETYEHARHLLDRSGEIMVHVGDRVVVDGQVSPGFSTAGCGRDGPAVLVWDLVPAP